MWVHLHYYKTFVFEISVKSILREEKIHVNLNEIIEFILTDSGKNFKLHEI